MKSKKNHCVSVYTAFLVAVLAGAGYAQDATTNKLNGITLRGKVVASAAVNVQNTNSTDFTVWTPTALNVQDGDVVVVSLASRDASSATAAVKEPAACPKIKIKTKSSPECVVAAGKKAFMATENAPLLYASAAGANVVFTLEVLRDSSPVPPKQQTTKKKKRFRN